MELVKFTVHHTDIRQKRQMTYLVGGLRKDEVRIKCVGWGEGKEER